MEPVYKQLALGWKITKQLSGVNHYSLSNNKNYRKRKFEFFLCNKHKVVIKPSVHQNSAVSKAFFWKILKSLIINIGLNPENYSISRRHRLLGQTTKQPLSNSEPQRP